MADVVLPNPVAGDLFDILKVSLKESTFIKKKRSGVKQIQNSIEISDHLPAHATAVEIDMEVAIMISVLTPLFFCKVVTDNCLEIQIPDASLANAPILFQNSETIA